MDDSKYLEMLESLITNYFGSKKEFAATVGIASTSLSRILSGKQQSVSDSFKDKVYSTIKDDLTIPEDIRSFFQTSRIDGIKNIVSNQDRTGLLIQKITKQIYENQSILKFKNDYSLYDVYNVMYDALDKLNYKIGALDKNGLSIFFDSVLQSLKDMLFVHSFNHNYAMIQSDDLYDIANCIFSTTSNHFPWCFYMPNDSLRLSLPKNTISFIKKMDNASNIDIEQMIYNEIALYQKRLDDKKLKMRVYTGLFGFRMPYSNQNVQVPMYISIQDDKIRLSTNSVIAGIIPEDKNLSFNLAETGNKMIQFSGMIYNLNEVDFS